MRFPDSSWWTAYFVPTDKINRITANTGNFNFLWCSSVFVFIFSILGRLWNPVKFCISYVWISSLGKGKCVPNFTVWGGLSIPCTDWSVQNSEFMGKTAWHQSHCGHLRALLKVWLPWLSWIKTSTVAQGLKSLL